MSTPTLYIFSGLPASGKTTLAKLLARHTKAMYIRIDTVEESLLELCNIEVEVEGYCISYRIASDNLELGNSAIADSCNTTSITREAWENVAFESGANFYNIEVTCSDTAEHKSRVAQRNIEEKRSHCLAWEQVQLRYYQQWRAGIIKIDTAGNTVAQSFGELKGKLGL